MMFCHFIHLFFSFNLSIINLALHISLCLSRSSHLLFRLLLFLPTLCLHLLLQHFLAYMKIIFCVFYKKNKSSSNFELAIFIKTFLLAYFNVFNSFLLRVWFSSMAVPCLSKTSGQLNITISNVGVAEKKTIEYVHHVNTEMPCLSQAYPVKTGPIQTLKSTLIIHKGFVLAAQITGKQNPERFLSRKQTCIGTDFNN